MPRPRKLVMTVIDGMKPSVLQRAIDTGQAPALKAVAERGTLTESATAVFPSVTPVCAASIATGAYPDRHHIPAMNWFSRDEGRYVEYGSSFSASRRFGITRQLLDTIYEMNHTHLSRDLRTVFEALDDEGLRTAGTTYLMYRGRHRHEPSREFALNRMVTSRLFRRAVEGPQELFYADLFASRRTGCWSQLGLPGVRDQHSGCVASYLVEQDLFDFLLLSLPDNDAHSHRFGPHAQVQSIAAADRQIERMMHAGGGIDAFLDQHAMIVLADHSHAPVEAEIDASAALGEWELLGPAGSRSLAASEAEIAFCPSQRSGQVYVLVEEGREHAVPRLVGALREVEGVDIVMWRQGGRAVLASERGELRFAPLPARARRAGAVRDARGRKFLLEGDLECLQATVEEGRLVSPAYPDALARCWAALSCPTTGDVLLSAAPGYEFPDWGGVSHLGGGSHGSLHRIDSEGALLFCGVRAPAARRRDGAWSITDVTPMALSHFGAAGNL